ncbi:Ldh family oxidoreductase [Phreatobacter stygius]|uniref:Ldh family oxidoreductase n=1 Tax=Phreatobacter stygius TaxID=1940610 RepID=A0A4D7B3W6_9HYPH|nr:Ldh family oxidoreductase [Phreatobacter stygius]QCI67591.1 Ldh family oxidoreductase [Phreatobacter stygius]
MSGQILLPAVDLADLARRLLIAAGTPEAHAANVAEALVDADIEGLGSHGLMLLPMYLDRIAAGSVVPAAEGRIVSDTGAQVVIDAENGLGHVSAERAAALAVERARLHGLAAVAVRNAFHFGAAGRFARTMAESGCIGMVMANTRPLMPAPGGAERVVGNNPIAIAVPTATEPVVLDLALSAGAMGKIRLAESRGDTIPPSWATDAAGVPTTDAAEAIKGMLLPAAGAKGFGLAVMIDLMTGGLASGAIGQAVQPLYGDLSKPYGSSNLFLAIDIAGFRPVADFAADASAFAGTVRGSRLAPGASPVRMPGDRAIKAHRSFTGACALAPATASALAAAAAKLGVALPPSLSR